MNNLIIGNTSQLNYYFPEDFKRISSRNIDIEFVKNGKFDRVFILFAEQRTFLNESESFFTEVNFDYTVKLINEIKDYVQSIVIYSTSELWNKYEGGVSIYNIENFVMEIYSLNNLNYFDYVVINNENSLKNFRNEYYSKIKYSSKEELLNLTYYDIQKYSFS